MTIDPRHMAPPPPPVGAPLRPGSPNRRSLVIAAFAVVVLAIGATVAILVLRPVTLPPPPAASLRASPSPGGGAGDSVRLAFADRVLADDLNYRMSASGEVTSKGATIHWTGAWEIAGRNYHVKTTGAGATEALIVGDKVWTRSGKARYALAASSPLKGRRWVPFLDVKAIRSLDYAGTADRDGTTYQVLRSNSSYDPDDAKLLGVPSVSGASAERQLEILVTEDGVPVAATFTYTAGSGTSKTTGTTTFTFSAVGTKNAIAAPK